MEKETMHFCHFYVSSTTYHTASTITTLKTPSYRIRLLVILACLPACSGIQAVSNPKTFLSSNAVDNHYTVSQKTVLNCFCQNFLKFPPILIIFATKMGKGLKLCVVHSFSTSPNLRVTTLPHNFSVFAIFLPKIIKIG